MFLTFKMPTPPKEFERFFNDCFVKDPAAEPITKKDIKVIWRRWKSEQNKPVNAPLWYTLERLLHVCGSPSTQNEFYGLREVRADPIIPFNTHSQP